MTGVFRAPRWPPGTSRLSTSGLSSSQRSVCCVADRVVLLRRQGEDGCGRLVRAGREPLDLPVGRPDQVARVRDADVLAVQIGADVGQLGVGGRRLDEPLLCQQRGERAAGGLPVGVDEPAAARLRASQLLGLPHRPGEVAERVVDEDDLEAERRRGLLGLGQGRRVPEEEPAAVEHQHDGWTARRRGNGFGGFLGRRRLAVLLPAARPRREPAEEKRSAEEECSQRGMLPCLRCGWGTRLVCSVRSARISFGRVWRGSITSSM